MLKICNKYENISSRFFSHCEIPTYRVEVTWLKIQWESGNLVKHIFGRQNKLSKIQVIEMLQYLYFKQFIIDNNASKN